MSATLISSHPRALYPPYLTWPEPPVLQVPSLAATTGALLSFNLLEGSQIHSMEGNDTKKKNGNLRLTRPAQTRDFGLLQIAEEAQVLDLDAAEGHIDGTESIDKSKLDKILSETVIVVPSKDEETSVIRAVISAVPESCLVILVSNCRRQNDDDRYLDQVAMVREFGRDGRQILAVHQKDHAAGPAFQASGMVELVDPGSVTILDGKGEGMLLGIALAAAFCSERRYIGFVDADNLRPASVSEYCKIFAAGFAMSPSPDLEDTMVRLRWSSKPKKRSNGEYEKVSEGRCSTIVNSWLNKLFAQNQGQQNGTHMDTTPFITTGNAGEHAMTMNLALKLRMAAGYAIEPYHFVDLLERGYLNRSKSSLNKGNTTTTTTTTNNNTNTQTTTTGLNKPIRILQIRTVSPHYHRDSDDDHIRRMWGSGLGSVYHGLAPYDTMPGSQDGNISALREDMREFTAKMNGLDPETGELRRPKIYPALEHVDMGRFREVVRRGLGMGSLVAFGVEGLEKV